MLCGVAGTKTPKSDAFSLFGYNIGLPSLDTTYKLLKIGEKGFSLANLMAYAKENKDLVLSNLSSGAICKLRSDLSPKIFMDPSGLSEFLGLSCKIVGEDKALNIIANLAAGYSTGYGQFGANNLGLLLSGPSGCGKSLATKIMTHCLVTDGYNLDGSMNEHCDSVYTITSADIDVTSSVPVHEQLLGDTSGGTGLKRQNNFKKYVEANPNGGVIVIEEIDKMMMTNRAVANALQELLRHIVEVGEVNVSGKKYQMKNYVIACTTNASGKSIRAEEGAYKLTEEERALGYTACAFDKSFLNRFHLIEFEPLSAASLSVVFNNLVENWNARFGNLHGVNAVITVETLAKIGKYLESTKNGGREAEKYFLNLSVPLYSLCEQVDTEFTSSGKSARDMSIVEIKFDDASNACTPVKIGAIPANIDMSSSSDKKSDIENDSTANSSEKNLKKNHKKNRNNKKTKKEKNNSSNESSVSSII